MLSISELVVRYDGGDATRLDKVRAFAGCDLALSTLRVCYHDPDRFNCCRCEKCIRTMMALRLCGALDRAVTFPEPLSLMRVRALDIPRRIRYYHECLLHAAEENGDEALGAALRAALGRTPSVSRLTLRGYRTIRRLSARAVRAASPRNGVGGPGRASTATFDKSR